MMKAISILATLYSVYQVYSVLRARGMWSWPFFLLVCVSIVLGGTLLSIVMWACVAPDSNGFTLEVLGMILANAVLLILTVTGCFRANATLVERIARAKEGRAA